MEEGEMTLSPQQTMEEDYYVIPPLDELCGSGTLAAKNLIVGRRGFGSVSFFGNTRIADIRSLSDLKRQIRIERHSVEVDANFAFANSIENNFEKFANVTFENVGHSEVWKLVRSHENIDTNVQFLALKREIGKIDELKNEPICEVDKLTKGPASFRFYDQKTKTFQFSVSSFSKYKLFSVNESSAPSSILTRDLQEENSAQNAFFSFDASRIIVKNGPVKQNPFLSEFRHVRPKTPESPPVSSKSASHLKNGESEDTPKSPVNVLPLDLPPLEGDADDPALLNHSTLNAPLNTPLNAPLNTPLNVFNDSAGLNLDVGSGDTSRHDKEDNLHHTTLTSDNHTHPRLPPLSEASLLMLDHFFPAYLKICRVTVDEGRIVAESPERAVDLLSLLANTIWTVAYPYNLYLYVEKLRYVRYAFTLLDALHRPTKGERWAEQTDKQTNEQTDEQTDPRTDRQADEQTDRQIDRQTDTEIISRQDSPDTGRAFLQWIRTILTEVREVPVLSEDRDLSETDWSGVHLRVFALLTAGRLDDGAVFAETEGDSDLADLITAVAHPPVSVKVDAQLQNVLAASLRSKEVVVSKILLLLTGIMSTTNVSVSEGLDWLSTLSVYALFAVNPASAPDVANIMNVYEDAELSDWGWNGPFSPDKHTDKHTDDLPPVALYHIINLFLGRTDLDALLRDLDSSHFDISFRWLLVLTLRSLGYFVETSIFESVTTEMAQSLEDAKKWTQAVSVWLHIPSSDVRERHIRSVVVSGLRLTEHGVDVRSIEKMLVEDLHVERAWFLEGIIARALRLHDYRSAACAYIERKEFSQAGRLILDKVLPEFERSGTLGTLGSSGSSGSSGVYEDLFSLTDALGEGVVSLPEMTFFRPFLPFFDLLKTFAKLQEGGEMSEVLLEQLEVDLQTAKMSLAREEVTPVVRKLIKQVDVFRKDLLVKASRKNLLPARSFFGRMLRKLIG